MALLVHPLHGTLNQGFFNADSICSTLISVFTHIWATANLLASAKNYSAANTKSSTMLHLDSESNKIDPYSNLDKTETLERTQWS